MRKIEKMWVWKMDRGVGGGEIQVENGKQKRDGMKLWEFAFEEKNFLPRFSLTPCGLRVGLADSHRLAEFIVQLR